jgi:glutamate---cysteine ligase / carboxylate-amine ligase
VQECPLADLSVAAATVGALRLLASGDPSERKDRMVFPTEALSDMLLKTIREGEQARIPDASYQKALGLRPEASATAGGIWSRLLDRMSGGLLQPEWHRPLRTILERGPLSRRILLALGNDFSRASLESAYRRLADCLAEGRLFDP